MGATSSAVAPHNKFPDDLDVTRHVKRKIGRSITNDHANSSTHSALTADLTASPSISPSSSIVSERVARGSPAFGITGAFSNTVLFPARGNLDFHEDPDKFELHCILRDPFGLKIFHKFAFDGKKKKEGRNRTIFFCWQDCETFRTMPSRNYRLARARSLYKKYLSGKSGIPLVLPRTLQKDKGTVEDFENVLSVIEKLKALSAGDDDGTEKIQGNRKDQERMVKATIFDPVANYCFRLLGPVFLEFKQTKYYTYFREKVRRHNKIKTRDFEYMKILGHKGRNGSVDRMFVVRKKSTKKIYVMKVQRKRDLLRNYYLKERSIHTERLCLLHCGNFSFVTQLQYAIQSKDYVIMVTDYATMGDLRMTMRKFKGGVLPLDRVFKYGRQIAFALGHMHSIGILHRDIKPTNIVLSASGNVKFCDLGSCGVIRPKDFEYDGNAFAVENNAHRVVYEGVSPANPNESSFLVLESESLPHPIRRLRRRRSLVGTFGYMAPDVCKPSISSSNEGYNYCADWFSFGCLLFKLGTGNFPFKASGKSACRARRKEAKNVMMNTLGFHTDVLGSETISVKKKETFVLQGDDLEDHFGLGPAAGEVKTSEDELREVVEYYREVMSRQVKFGEDKQGFWDLVKGLLEVDVVKRLGSNGSEEVIDHKFFAGNDDYSLLAEMDEDLLQTLSPKSSTSSSTSKSNGFAPGFDAPEFSSFEEACAAWVASNCFVLESVKNTDPKLQKVTDKEHFDKWDYTSIDAVDEEMLTSNRRSSMGVGLGGMRKSVSDGDIAGMAMSMSMSMGSSSIGGSLERSRRQAGGTWARDIIDGSRHAILDVIKHSVLDDSRSMYDSSPLDQSIKKGLNSTKKERKRRESFRSAMVGEDGIWGEDELEKLGNMAMEEALLETQRDPQKREIRANHQEQPKHIIDENFMPSAANQFSSDLF